MAWLSYYHDFIKITGWLYQLDSYLSTDCGLLMILSYVFPCVFYFYGDQIIAPIQLNWVTNELVFMSSQQLPVITSTPATNLGNTSSDFWFSESQSSICFFCSINILNPSHALFLSLHHYYIINNLLMNLSHSSFTRNTG